MGETGILGIGTFLPANVRTNDWWPREVVAQWADRSAARVTQGEARDITELPASARRTLEAMSRHAVDPFRGALERRVMPEGMTVGQMEAAAAREAMQRAGVVPADVDVLLTQTPVPEQLFVNAACVTHKLLELPQKTLVLATQAACNAFAMHASIARGLIASGQARHVLSVHSSAMTRIVGSAEPDSAWWGDGAAAVVFGPVSDGRGFRSIVHNADGASCDALVLGVQGRRWWEDGAITLHHGDRNHTRAMLLGLADRSRTAIRDAMTAAGVAASEVEFYASHQGTVWLTEVTAEQAGLQHAKTVVTFPTLGNMNSVNIPMILALAERRSQITDGSTIVTFAGGVGETWSSTCLRWGR